MNESMTVRHLSVNPHIRTTRLTRQIKRRHKNDKDAGIDRSYTGRDRKDNEDLIQGTDMIKQGSAFR